jgi:hypothetical protein
VRIYAPGNPKRPLLLDTIATPPFNGLSGMGMQIEVRFRVLKRGRGDGAVFSSPLGIACGPTCQHGFDFGERVSLVAVPAEGSVFRQWEGACSSSPRCDVVSGPVSAIRARFEPA